MITFYGYQDGSGEYYIVIDGEKCNSCSECTKVCPQSALKMDTIFIDLEDKMVATITEKHRKKIRYTCSPCQSENENLPCVNICKKNAIKCIWKPK
ncbi:4Fe-4S binding protein [Candidatus Bathyarchaeota archaeon]|nr:4Fe-4S binding protein [Candidatus Bathyarchaeota archaeon]